MKTSVLAPSRDSSPIALAFAARSALPSSPLLTSLLAEVAEANETLNGALSPADIRRWARCTYGGEWRANMTARTVVTGIYILALYRRECPPVEFQEYLRHRVWAVEGCRCVIEPIPHTVWRKLLPRPETLALYKLSGEWMHPWSEASRAVAEGQCARTVNDG